MCYKLMSKYYWNTIKINVAKYISSCDQCQWCYTSHLQKIYQHLHPIPIPMKPVSMFGIDLMKLKESQGYNYAITAIDYFTKYMEMGCIKQKSATEVTTWIYNNIFCRYGVCNIHITGNGTEFVNAISKELYSRTGVTHCLTSLFHPQANGLVEHMNQTTTATLKKILQDRIHKQKDWSQLISTIAWTVRSNMHKSTMYEPIHFLIGRHPKLPPKCEQFDLDITKNPDITEEEVNEMIEKITSENLVNISPLDLHYIHMPTVTF